MSIWLRAIKQALEAQLRQVMVRTERLAATADRDGMLAEVPCQAVRLAPNDLSAYCTMQTIARLLDQPDTLEYWKSAPYLLNFMEGYQIKQAFRAAIGTPDLDNALAQALKAADGLLLPQAEIATYRAIDPGNARLRDLLAATIEPGAWRLLWIPPALPYYRLDGPFADPSLSGFTKRLVFSSWRVVPKIIAILLSYEAERQMICSFEEAPENSPEARKRRSRLLRFARVDGHPTGMPVLSLIYPSPVLAQLGDPLALVAGTTNTAPPTSHDLLNQIAARIDAQLTPLCAPYPDTGVEDEAWYWAAPLLLNRAADPHATRTWWNIETLASTWNSGSSVDEDEDSDSNAWADHVAHARTLVQNPASLNLGRPPADLAMVLAQLALAGPGVTALRALGRVTVGAALYKDSTLRTPAAQLAWGFLRLFNLPEVQTLLRGMNANEKANEPYWRRVLEYCVAGGLQAVLDEYAHIMRESEGLLDGSAATVAQKIASEVQQALVLRTAAPHVDDIIIEPAGKTVQIQDYRMRERFALRFGDARAEEGSDAVRADLVRKAFNSPFWPFVLATTSVGQEGLDFHPYCHAVVHWNLPANSVDLKQREGRVHRYKGHAVRKNLARHYGLARYDGRTFDPWEHLFQSGSHDRPASASDLVPFWVYSLPGEAKVERHVPALPLSRDQVRLANLHRALAVYRMVIGQSRQEDLVAYLLARLPETMLEQTIQDLRINLEPPHSYLIAKKDAFNDC